jgi:hypothetical protein
MNFFRVLFCRHKWQADYMTGVVKCSRCEKVSKKNYYRKRNSEKY